MGFAEYERVGWSPQDVVRLMTDADVAPFMGRSVNFKLQLQTRVGTISLNLSPAAHIVV